MLIIGCDFHTRYQQMAMAREETGELLSERRLDHESGEAQAFYRSLQDSAGGRPLTCRGDLDFVFSRRGGASLRCSGCEF